jgi:hypothetical protein
MSLLSAAMAAIVLWLLSGLITVRLPFLLLLLVLVFLAQPLGGLSYKRGKGLSVKWDLKDYIGIALIIAVFYAIYTGIDPKTLICSLISCKT